MARVLAGVSRCSRAAIAAVLALVLVLGQAGWPPSSSSATAGLFGPGDICSAHHAEDGGAQSPAKPGAPCCQGHCCCHALSVFVAGVPAGLSDPVLIGAASFPVARMAALSRAAAKSHRARAPPASA